MARRKLSVIALFVSTAVVGCSQHSVATSLIPTSGNAQPTPFVVQGGPPPAEWVAFTPSQVPGTPSNIVNGSDHSIWYTESAGNAVDRLGMRTDRITRFVVPTQEAGVDGITVGPDRNIWFTEYHAGKIGTVRADGTIVEYSLPTGASPTDIKSGPDGNLWFIDVFPGRHEIGRMTTSGSVTEFVTPSGNQPSLLAVGSDGNLWFTENGSPNIGRSTTSGVITEFPTHATETVGITSASDGNIWFAETFNHSLGRITPSGAVTEYYVHGRFPTFLTSGGDGPELFVTVEEGLAEYNIRTHKFTVLGNAPNFPGTGPLTVGSDGNVWFAQPPYGTISVFVRNVLTVVPASLTLTVGQSETLTASEPTATLPLQAKSSNSAVATVAPAGSNTFNVKAIGEGSCTITVFDHKGNSFPVHVSVQ